MRWDLTAEVTGLPKSISQDQAEVALQYRHPRPLVEKRRRALLWLAVNLGWRRSELASLRVQDLNMAAGTIHMASPAKGGAPMTWPIPADAFSPKRPVQAWLAVRPVDAERPDAFWVHQRYPGDTPHAYTVGGLGREMDEISHELGFRIGFTRCRRYDTTRLDEAEVSMRIIQAKRNHKKIDTTIRYAGKVTAERALDELIRKGAPGFKARGRRGNRGINPEPS